MANTKPNFKPVFTRQVWAYNLIPEFHLISKLISHYSFIGMDTEFPGSVFNFPNTESYNYHNLTPSDNYTLLKANVDALKIIQVGLTITDASGNLPDLGTKYRYIWQFNFRDFNLACDWYAPDSIALLQRQGIDFAYNATHGIHSAQFGHLMIYYGLLYNYNLTWVTFHGSYDFGYLVKIITRRILPTRLEEFLWFVKVMFGDNVYDVKHMMRSCQSLYGGLDRVARTLNIDRVGTSHQAGPDSFLTLRVFQKIRDTYFIDEEHKKHVSVLFGLELESGMKLQDFVNFIYM
ncbi:hypothetical protein TanjilG_09178 [Lupinus angustifolius]|uniref:poly(A)-specific ribonuclease n=1 Tax=Lupinus angustifolius TaxID=3871 RepID=A0A394DF93_LUPAN|nr:PREDICTED: probable CCR4-associated factor 1 homolog 9 [Lupinus angustifolius]OIW21756.1 hypothetical protein TanjilG_09178 [Lupinus angustifolius]